MTKLNPTNKFGHDLLAFDTLDSTNKRAMSEAQQGAAEGTVVWAALQTAGRGRFGRAWESRLGDSLCFSLILRPPFEIERAPLIPLVLSVSVARFLADLGGERVQIKWPNDVLLDGKKVCGILVELAASDNRVEHMIAGIGINVRSWEMESGLADHVTSLMQEHIKFDTATESSEYSVHLERRQRFPAEDLRACKHLSCSAKKQDCTSVDVATSDILSLLWKLLPYLEEDYRAFCASNENGLGALRPTYDRYLLNQNVSVEVLDPHGNYTGIARGIGDAGELLVEIDDGELRRIYAGEVSVRGIGRYAPH
ncbi:MAG: biotin--[acetyl-CoA-carboxylase] ligase [Clostridium sp.]|jgi:BirA family biotin operon repressor/biotin-[acetyl-CoA-carboxylase] ligase|nr:biotin--[acetyl-CoA-carboxylase] ligase [Clostridium sp.]